MKLFNLLQIKIHRSLQRLIYPADTYLERDVHILLASELDQRTLGSEKKDDDIQFRREEIIYIKFNEIKIGYG